MRGLLAAELLKTRKRWLPYILLLPVLAALAFQTFVGYFAIWRHEGDIEGLHVSVLPWSLPSLLDLAQYLATIVLAILAASTVATEHGWGTVRQALIRGQTRSQYLTTKLLGLAVVGGIGFLLVLAFGVLLSAILTAVEDRGSPDSLSAFEGLLMIVRAAYGVLPYMLLAFCLAVVGRSTTLGVAGVLLYVIGEAIVLSTLGGIGGATADARAYFIGHNVVALSVANQVGQVDHFSLAPRERPLASELPDPAIAALVLALYCGVFLAIAYWTFQRRDLGVESGGG